MIGLGCAELLEHLQRDIDAFDRCLAADLRAPVLACPGWDVGRLAIHLGRTHRWAMAALAGSDAPQYPARPDPPALRAWFAEGAAELVGQLRARDAAQPCWSLWQPQSTVGFWVRRQAHETAMHRWDAETAVGGSPAIDRPLAADGTAEVVDVLYPRQVALGRQVPLVVALELRSEDERWHLGGSGPTATLTSDAEALLLLLWKRRSLSQVLGAGGRLAGERAVAEAVLAAQLTP